MGAVAGVLGVLAAFTFSAGVADAAANPARFGQTNQLETYIGENGQDFGPAGPVLRAVAAGRDVTGLDDARIAVAQSGQVSISTYTYDPVGGKRLPVVLTAPAAHRTGRDSAGPDHGQATPRHHRLGHPAHRRGHPVASGYPVSRSSPRGRTMSTTAAPGSPLRAMTGCSAAHTTGSSSMWRWSASGRA